MKKTISSLAIAAAMTFGFVNLGSAQDTLSNVATDTVATEMVDSTTSIADQATEGASVEEWWAVYARWTYQLNWLIVK